jgi:hypothetical protein
MKTLAIGLVGLVLLSFTFLPNGTNNHLNSAQNSINQSSKNDAVVFICKGPKSYAYHSRSRCSGLNNCSTEIHEVYESDAISMRRTACQKCYL